MKILIMNPKNKITVFTHKRMKNGRVTVFGGDQTRPNIHIKDMVGVYLHVIENGEKMQGIYNAGFENISIMDIARQVTEHVPAEIVVTESNDPRSYRLNSDKLLDTGFVPRYGVIDGITDVIEAYKSGVLRADDNCHNISNHRTFAHLG